MTGLHPQGTSGCDHLTTVPQLHHSWGYEHHADVSGQCSALGQWRQWLKPDRQVYGATCTALLIPNPPDLTWSVAWLQLGLSLGKWMLVIALTMALG